MLVSRAIAAVAAAATLVVGLTTPASALKDDTPPPVAVADTIALYPYQTGRIDLLANDSSPSGQELHLCRFPEGGFDSAYGGVYVFGTGEGGKVEVMPFGFRGKDVTVEYFVCDDTNLTPATLTVKVKDVEPVEVVKTGKPGQLRVTNTNDVNIVFRWGNVGTTRPDGKVVVPAGGTELVRVSAERIVWIATIGRGGIADHGRVRDIELPR